MIKETITITNQEDRYEVICKVSKALPFLGKERKEFMQSIYLDMNYEDVLELAKKYVNIIETPRIEYDSQGESGNIYHILAQCQKALRKQYRIDDYNTLRDRVYESKSYEDALAIVSEYIDLIEVKGRK